jgi:hypothetical protein
MVAIERRLSVLVGPFREKLHSSSPEGFGFFPSSFQKDRCDVVERSAFRVGDAHSPTADKELAKRFDRTQAEREFEVIAFISSGHCSLRNKSLRETSAVRWQHEKEIPLAFVWHRHDAASAPPT